MAKKGSHLSPETKAKISAALRGHKRLSSHAAKLAHHHTRTTAKKGHHVHTGTGHVTHHRRKKV